MWSPGAAGFLQGRSPLISAAMPPQGVVGGPVASRGVRDRTGGDKAENKGSRGKVGKGREEVTARPFRIPPSKVKE